MGYPQVSVETDRELVLRYARRFTSRKDIQRLRDLLQVVDSVLDPRGDPPDAEKQVFESVKRRVGQIDEELSALSRALVASGLIDDKIERAVDLRAEEHISQQAATLSADIAAKVAAVRSELEGLEGQRDLIADELESRRRKAEREIERNQEEFDKLRLQEEARVADALRDLDKQRDTLSRHLERVIEKYQGAREEIINQFVLLAPFFQRAGLVSAIEPKPSDVTAGDGRLLGEPLEFPAFVTGSVDEKLEAPITELEFFARFERHVKDCGYGYRRLDLISFHVSVKCCDITILGGISGTGKSTLPLLYAEALAGDSSNPTSSRYLNVGVSPSWLDMRDLLGHVNSLESSV